MKKRAQVAEKELFFQGYPICPGIAIGKPFFFHVPEEQIPEINVTDVEEEVARYNMAWGSSFKDISHIKERYESEGSKEISDILASHLEIMKDPVMTHKVEQEIRAQGKNTEYVFKLVIGEVEQKLKRVPTQLFRERVKDVQDISRRIMKHLRKDEKCTLAHIASSVIVFAHELAPSDTAEARTDCIDAFVTRSGAETSHVAIMARARGIPFVSSVEFPDLSGMSISKVIVDGTKGCVILNPSKESLDKYKKEQKKLKVQAMGLKKAQGVEAETIDGCRIQLSANIEIFNEVEALSEHGVGVGLFRSEYLFLARDGFPTEDEQFAIYRSIVEKVGSETCVIRTFDIGGDKLGNLHPTRYESNPYLGCRAIRFMLKERNYFKAQVRAILRASAFGEVSILFPMISEIGELREAKAIVEEARLELRARGVPFARKIPLGCMIEVPSAALISDLLAKECDFLSIGTNDLVQYTLAVDRNNPQMSYLYTPGHPSILRLIKMVADEGRRAKIPVALCGEIAANPKFTALLLGLGIRELSVGLPSLPVIKNIIRKLSIADVTDFANHILQMTTPQEIERAISSHHEQL